MANATEGGRLERRGGVDDRGTPPTAFSVCWDEEPTETEPPMTMEELLRMRRPVTPPER